MEEKRQDLLLPTSLLTVWAIGRVSRAEPAESIVASDLMTGQFSK